MELLVQMWCPLERSPYDRAIYIWGCAKGGCQRQEGCVRAWRGLRFNNEYAAKLKGKRVLSPESDVSLKMQDSPKTNPFSLTSNISPPSVVLGVGSDLFGSQPATHEDTTTTIPNESNTADSDTESTNTESSIVVALASATLSDSSWGTAPTYPPLYLSTISEYFIPEKPSKKTSPEDAIEDTEGGGTWSAEKYENSMEIDQVFDRFNRRVSAQAEQCVRYELGGTPLPFASDDVFKHLFPRHGEDRSAVATVVTRSAFAPGPAGDGRRFYDPSSVPACSQCRGRRVFECQLMPNLINVLVDEAAETPNNDKSLADEERRQAVELMLKGNKENGRGMEWGTILIFSCEEDCCSDNYGWSEEHVLVQWDN